MTAIILNQQVKMNAMVATIKLMVWFLIPVAIAFGLSLFSDDPKPFMANIDILVLGWMIVVFFNADILKTMINRQILILKIKLNYKFTLEDAQEELREHATDVARIDQRKGEIRFLINKKHYTLRLKQD